MVERLTKQIADKYYYKSMPNQDNLYINKVVTKLGKLEDIEEELGIPLEVLFKALKEGVWTKASSYSCFLCSEPTFIKGLYLHIGYYDYTQYDNYDYDGYFSENDALCIFEMHYEDHHSVTRIKDYGKTWALTKEELE